MRIEVEQKHLESFLEWSVIAKLKAQFDMPDFLESKCHLCGDRLGNHAGLMCNPESNL